MARVFKEFHSFTCTPRVHPLTEWIIPAFAFPAEAGTHLPIPEGWKAELTLDINWGGHSIRFDKIDIKMNFSSKHHTSIRKWTRRRTGFVLMSSLQKTIFQAEQADCKVASVSLRGKGKEYGKTKERFDNCGWKA